jgi:hypothetical protein
MSIGINVGKNFTNRSFSELEKALLRNIYKQVLRFSPNGKSRLTSDGTSRLKKRRPSAA